MLHILSPANDYLTLPTAEAAVLAPLLPTALHPPSLFSHTHSTKPRKPFFYFYFLIFIFLASVFCCPSSICRPPASLVLWQREKPCLSFHAKTVIGPYFITFAPDNTPLPQRLPLPRQLPLQRNIVPNSNPTRALDGAQARFTVLLQSWARTQLRPVVRSYLLRSAAGRF